MDDPNSFLLLKALVSSSCCSPAILEMKLRAIIVRLSYSVYEQKIICARGAIPFIYNCWNLGTSFEDYLDWRLPPLQILKALCHIGVVFDPRVRYISYSLSFNASRKNYYHTFEKNEALLTVLFRMFQFGFIRESELFVGQWIRCGWIGTASNDPEDTDMLSFLIISVHKREQFWVAKLFLITRQLLALGLVRNGDLPPLNKCERCYMDNDVSEEEFDKSEEDSDFLELGKSKTKCLDVNVLSLQK